MSPAVQERASALPANRVRRAGDMGRVTLQSIADRTGVSRMTVSNAFSRPDQLSAELRERILAAAEELGYVGPDPAARALAKGSVGAVGVLLTDRLSDAFRDDVATAFLAAVADALAARGLALTLLTPATGTESVPARDVAVDGALVYVCDPDSPDLAWLTKRGLPMVGVDQPPAPELAAVNVDDRVGARAAAQHLLDLGHRRIGVLTLGKDEGSRLTDLADLELRGFAATERLAGWLAGLDPAGITPTVALSPYRPPEAAYDGARALLDQPERPTAILCFSDAFAAETVRAARDLGLSVPGDLSVVGYDDSSLSRLVDPPLSTVRQDLAAKAEEAVAKLAAVMTAAKRGEQPEVERTVLPTELVVRGSTGPAPQEA